MLINGRVLAEQIYARIKTKVEMRDIPPHLTIFTCVPDAATQQYLALKKQKAAAVGIPVNVIEVPETITSDEMVTTVMQAQMRTDGIVVQLPLPRHLGTARVLDAIPIQYDVDGVHYDGTDATVLSPVVAAIAHLCLQYRLSLAQQQVVVVGHGRLVGQPAALWAKKQGAQVTVVTRETDVAKAHAAIAQAEVLILGAGQAGYITPSMVRSGVVIFDAGTSESSGALCGDADPACAAQASLMTPVPGGIGPLTVACLLRNLVELTE